MFLSKVFTYVIYTYYIHIHTQTYAYMLYHEIILEARGLVYFASHFAAILSFVPFFIPVACSCAVHKKCHNRILHRCPGNAKESRETKMLTERMGINVPHRLVVAFYSRVQ